MIKMIIVEDQQILLDSLADSLSLEKDIEVLQRCQDSSKIVGLCEFDRPDLVLMDICSKDGNTGLSETVRLKETYPGIKVILMTAMPDMNFLEEAKAVGADSFIYKNCAKEELLKCIRDTMRDYRSFPDKKEAENPIDLELSDREKEILRCVCKGLSRRETAEELSLSENTVRNNIARILMKTGYDSIAQLAIFVVSKGYIVPESQL